MQGSGHGLIPGNIPAFAWKGRRFHMPPECHITRNVA